MNYLEDYYSNYNEEGRLLSQHGQVEYRTTMKYIREALAGDKTKRILEVGAGTGRYSVTLAKEGFSVTAVELVAHNLEILKSKLDGTEDITALQGNALDLSRFPDESFDLTLVLGPLYHLYTKEDKLQALSEAARVTKPGGILMVAYYMNEATVIQYVFGLNKLRILSEAARVTRSGGQILAAYCMNDATVIQYVFGHSMLREVLAGRKLTEDWRCLSLPQDLFEMVRTEEIAELDAQLPVKRLKLVATDGATNYLRPMIDGMDAETFEKWMEFHLITCERQDLIGASNHTLDILEKK